MSADTLSAGVLHCTNSKHFQNKRELIQIFGALICNHAHTAFLSGLFYLAGLLMHINQPTPEPLKPYPDLATFMIITNRG